MACRFAGREKSVVGSLRNWERVAVAISSILQRLGRGRRVGARDWTRRREDAEENAEKRRMEKRI